MTQAAAEPSPVLPRVAEGDDAAVEEALERYGNLVWALARRMLGGSSEAEDAVQEIFVELWQSAGRFDSARGSEVTFVATIARRRLIDRRRRIGRRPTQVSLGDGPLPAEGGAPLEVPARGEDVRQAMDAFETLRPEQQKVLRMSLMDGMSHAEIAEATGMPVGTVKTHSRRGLIQIRSVLAEGGSGGSG